MQKVRDKSLKENYITEDGHTASARIDARQKRERERLKIKHDREDGRAARQDAAAKDTARRVAERFKQSDVDGLEKFGDRFLKKF